MPCYRPIKAWYSSNSARLSFRPQADKPAPDLKVPCGRCIGCRLERSRQWAVRCVHEAQMHDDNCFVTLTYNDEHLPEDGGLKLKHFQKYMKRLRKRLNGKRISYFHCGEYGEKNLRPHYHACIFGYDYPDRLLFKKTNGVSLYLSPMCDHDWKLGFTTIGDVTFESAAYVARYIMKKVIANDRDGVSKEHEQKTYERVDPTTGEVFQVDKEYTTMSRNPGIGKLWFEKYGSEVYPSDTIVARGHAMRPPRAYDTYQEQLDPQVIQDIKKERVNKAGKFVKDNTRSRLEVREKVKNAQIKLLQRNL